VAANASIVICVCISQSVLHVLDGVLMPGPLPGLAAQQGDLAGVTMGGCGPARISYASGVIAVATLAVLMMGELLLICR
jgi:hypothetical protein